MKEIVIVSAVRTPVGCFNGVLSSIPATRLGSVVITEAIKRSGIKPTDVDEVIMGNVLSASLGQAPARQASLGAGLPYTTNCLTINKVCGSGLKAVMLASQSIALGDAEIIVAGGMESMSRAPYLMEKARFGYRMGDGNIIDSMIKDGLWDVYNNIHMGSCAEVVAERYNISRDELDRYALQSYQRAIEAQKKGYFTDEIVSITNSAGQGITADEEPARHNLSKLKTLSPVFKEGGRITAGNSSKISDGAAAVVMMSGDKARELKIRPMAKGIAYASQGVEPEMFSIAPAGAIKKILKKTGLTLNDIDLFEINEAFATSILAVIKELNLDEGRLNVHGGAIAIGHPIGASGARILTTLLYAMKRKKAKRGIAAICIGGGEALAMLVERVEE
ncbi:MAG: acetyl-CoA acetyltransferase [Nitrospinae bacterium RIFCSPLOWO2_02_FULL_39_110]|nr:MAG: acetyl-CoA acetyltransferase [Nitrospinae bacterium RIFCSPHIGHO2_02_39_11]OGV99752.1 MAG: acetyl-CoA acetyltransferase [Nitrospinae bacterium RIFCSPHIGHO2_02_FULL_39_82]OGW01124.1 MAG: acetyl-CoA acetyltransferase [Nitrospinae bacterium RIFCSPHIGHO2_12_FULL_39_42]OGW02055.1 MAG: acetyl-CoA acetyltransferase [Nitrospinae bacterium RIFCSPLOWO2_02_39_17]OGW05496.1 MAG: acetyl-CoA acetyltransferase [Nitrospinae bacterium RIFCSPLOWO2_02_FULL_39_110]OGW10921.1 MAG: acetyl-CoA acetyltransfera